jgi:mono/diheme cytochrome c family protein
MNRPVDTASYFWDAARFQAVMALISSATITAELGKLVFRYARKALLAGATATGLTTLCAAYAVAQTELATGPFTAVQVEDGRKAFLARCAACHQANLQGQGEALPLAGRRFMAGWNTRTSQDLYNLIHASMPQGAPNSLDDQTYANLTAFILYANGAKPGPTLFLRAPSLPIGLIANGIAPGDLNIGTPLGGP